MSKKTNKTDAKLVDSRVVNVFLTYKHQPEEKHYIEEATLDKIKKLLNDAIQGVKGCDGVNLIYDRNCGYDYSKINELYNITDIDIYAITEGVAESKWIRQDIDAMNARKVPIIPIRFEGYKDNIGAVCNTDTVDAMPIELTDGSDPTEEDIDRVTKVISETMRGFNQKERDKLNKKVEKDVKIENGELCLFGMPIVKLRRITSGYLEGLGEGAEEVAKDLGRKTPGRIVAWIVGTISALGGGDFLFTKTSSSYASAKAGFFQALSNMFTSCADSQSFICSLIKWIGGH